MSKEEIKGETLLERSADRRQVLKITIAGAATLLVLPSRWTVPTVYAQTAPPTGAASAPPTTLAPTTTVPPPP